MRKINLEYLSALVDRTIPPIIDPLEPDDQVKVMGTFIVAMIDCVKDEARPGLLAFLSEYTAKCAKTLN